MPKIRFSKMTIGALLLSILWLPSTVYAAKIITNRLTIRASTGYFVSANAGGGSNVTVDRTVPLGWESFTLTDLTGSTLKSGDQVLLQAANGQFVTAVCGGGFGGACGVVNANSPTGYGWETFTIFKASGSIGAAIQMNDRVSIRTSGGFFCSADVNGGGAGSILTCNRSAVFAWETFTLGGLPISTGVAGDGTAEGAWIGGSPVRIPASQPQRPAGGCIDPNNPRGSNFAYAKDLTAIVMNLCWGGGVYEYWWNGHQFENNITNGALIQIDIIQYSTPSMSQSATVNPTQAGQGEDKRGAGVNAYGYWPNAIYSQSTPLNFRNPNDWGKSQLAGPDDSTDVVFSGLKFMSALTPSFKGNWQVTAYQSIINSNSTEPNFLIQNPAMYLKANFDKFYTYSTITKKKVAMNIPTPACADLGWPAPDAHDPFKYQAFWNDGTGFKSNCGIVFATDEHDDFDAGYSIGVYGCTPDLGGSVTQLVGQNQSCNWRDNGAQGHGQAVLYSEYASMHSGGRPLPIGQKVFTTYIITGTSPADLIKQAQDMYDRGVR